MYKIIAENVATGEKKEFEFETAEDAKIYKRYHLRFGHWASGNYWIDESQATQEIAPFIVDEMSELKNGVARRVYHVCVNWKIKEEIATGSELLDCWMLIREERNKKLKETDWTQLSDVPFLTAERGEWKKYRQYLRDFPGLHTDVTVAEAVIADFNNWRNGVR
jgi:hypothetical protein